MKNKKSYHKETPLQRKVRVEAYEIWGKMEPQIKKQRGYNYSGEMGKNACLLYCNLKQYAQPDNKRFWGEVAEYIDKRF